MATKDKGKEFEKETALLAGKSINGKPYGRRIPMCFSSDTRIFTIDGFKGIDELKDKDLVATLQNRELVYTTPLQIFKYDYRGPLIHIKSSKCDLLVNGEHNVYLSKGSINKFIFIKANEFIDRYAKTNVMQTSVNIWNGVDKDEFVFPEFKSKSKFYPSINLKMDDWLRFLGLYLSEGCIGGDCITIYQHERNEDIIRSILDGCNFKYHVLTYRRPSLIFKIYGYNFVNYFKQFGISKDKHIPKEFKNLSKRQLSILFESLYFGDGSKRDNAYHTTSEILAQDVFELCLKLGHSATIRKIERNDLTAGRYIHRPLYRLNIRPNKIYHRLNPNIKPEIVDYDGVIWCIQVGFPILVERNGNICWTGNSGAIGTITGVSALCGDASWDLPWLSKSIRLETKHGYGDPKKEVKSIRIQKEWFDKLIEQSEHGNFHPMFAMKFKFTRSDDIMSKFIMIPFPVMSKVLKDMENLWLELEELREYKDEHEKRIQKKTN